MLGQLGNFIKRYWIVFAVCISYGLITNVYTFDWSEFLKNLFGLSSTYNGEWWYVRQYFDLLLMFPLVFCVEKWLSILIRKNGSLFSALIVLVPLAVLFIWRERIYNFCFLLGMLSVSTGAFDWLCERLVKTKFWKYLVAIVLLVVPFVLRIKFGGARYDYVLVTLFVFGLLIIIKSKVFEKCLNVVFSFVGKYSTYIWLTHTFFAYYFFQKFTFFFISVLNKE